MPNPTPEKPRIVSEFYVAEHHWHDTPENEWYLIHRIGDERMDTVRQVMPNKDRFGNPYGLEEHARHELNKMDEQARHFYAAGQAEALGRVDRAAEALGNGFEVDFIHRKRQWEIRWNSEPDVAADEYGDTFTEALLAAAPLEGGTGTGEAGLVGTTASAPESEVLPSTGTARVAVTATVKCDGCGYATEQISPGANIINERCCKCFAGFMRPIGTIFELDLFRERLEWFAATFGTDEEKRSEYVGKHLQDLAAELKTLIDNCREQYVPALAADPVQEGESALEDLHACAVLLVEKHRGLGNPTASNDFYNLALKVQAALVAAIPHPVQEGRAVELLRAIVTRIEAENTIAIHAAGEPLAALDLEVIEHEYQDAVKFLAATRAVHTEGNDRDAGADASPTDKKCDSCGGPLIDTGMGNPPECRQSVVLCPEAELAWKIRLGVPAPEIGNTPVTRPAKPDLQEAAEAVVKAFGKDANSSDYCGEPTIANLAAALSQPVEDGVVLEGVTVSAADRDDGLLTVDIEGDAVTREQPLPRGRVTVTITPATALSDPESEADDA